MQWSTKAELAFVRELGLHRQRCRRGAPASIDQVPPQARLALLWKYKAAMRLRVDWDFIDPVKVGEEVERLIAELEQCLAQAPGTAEATRIPA